MPRVTVYVTDDLKARMQTANSTETIGDPVNWSLVAQHAFSKAISIHNLQKDPTNMEELINRLRESKRRSEEGQQEAGRIASIAWATHQAEYDQLKKLTRVLTPCYSQGKPIFTKDKLTMNKLIELLGNPPTEKTWDQFFNEMLPPRHYQHYKIINEDAFVLGFAMGAKSVFDKVKDKL